MHSAPRWGRPASSAAAFLVPALALALPSGYSWGAVLLLLASLASVRFWIGQRLSRGTLALAGVYGAMAALWLLEGASGDSLKWLDRPLKFLLAVPCLLYLAACPPRPRWWFAGVLAGAWGAGVIAIAQWAGCRAGVSGLPLFSAEACEAVVVHGRVSGYTNAIQFGDLALLLALQCLAVMWVDWRRRALPWRLAWLGAAALGLEASLLSMTRGGWLALALVLPLAAYLALRWSSRRAMAVTALSGLVLLGALVGLKGDDISGRIRLGWQEAQQYRLQGHSDTSVGHRMAHWSLAWQMAQDRPWTGWTQAGYEAEKARRVAAGQAPEVVLRFGHAHNELLDMLAKRGFAGLLVLMALYLVPLGLFFPTPRRLRAVATAGASAVRTALALRAAGSLLPLAYMGFGLTQVFFAHNSGVMFYLFMVALVHAALLGHERACARRLSDT